MKRSLWLSSAICLSCLLVACGGGSAPPPATHFSVSTPPAAAAGTAFNFTVTALDASNSVATSYSGTVHFTSSDNQAVLPPNSTLKSGTGTFSATLKTSGSQTITATDTTNALLTGISPSITLSSGAASHFSITVPATAYALTAFNFTVTALDAFANTATSYSGTVHFTSSDSEAVLPADSPLTNGVGNFSATFQTTGGQTITATDTVTSITGTSSVITVFAPCSVNLCNLGGPPCCPGYTCDRTFCRAGGSARPAWIDPDSPPFELASRFTAICPMGTARASHTTTLLSNGLVLVTGGDDRNVSLASAELFDPASHSFAPAGDMADARARHTATLLTNGAVLVIGGRDAGGNALATAELFNATSMSFASTASMNTARESLTATLLSNGKVLIAGGDNGTVALASAELFDPTTMSFAPAESMGTPRSFHAATLLKNGKVLVTGGRDADGHVLATAELFDPTVGSFTPTGSMQAAREFHTATLLGDGKVLITGGDNGKVTLTTAELFDPVSGRFTPTGTMQAARELHTATLRNDGTVLVAGGVDSTSAVNVRPQSGLLVEPTATAELFDPASGSFTRTSTMVNARARHTAILLPDGEVLVTGGMDPDTSARRDSLASAELFR